MTRLSSRRNKRTRTISKSIQINEVVSIEYDGETGLLSFQNPPVNALGQKVRAGLIDGLQRLNGDHAIKVIALFGVGRCFSAGADIREFAQPPLAPYLPDVCDAIETSAKPVVAVLHGLALGGGFEIAISAQARVGTQDLKMALPEVLIGLLPGSGGTQRAPRLTGIPAALDLILSGRQISAQEAQKIGLIDRVDHGPLRDVARAAARDVISGALTARKTRDLKVADDPDALKGARARITAKSPHLMSPQKCIDAIALSTGPFEDGMKAERQAFFDCIASDQGKALRHAFFAERAVAKIPEAGETARDITAIGVIGGGTMGSGIATSALLAGLHVTLVEVTQQALERGVATITKNLDGAVKRAKLAGDKRDETLARLTPSTQMGALTRADLVIEAVFEDMDVKKEIFLKLDQICKPGAVLASNTSYLDVNDIAAATSRPGDVIGLHFFSPAHVMRLLEVVVGEKTTPQVVATGFTLARKLRKIAVRAGVCDGFIGNRILAHYQKVATYMLMDGASPQDIDRALEDFGFAMGPFKVSDLAGLDIGWASRKRKAPTRPAGERYVEIADRICENGWFGRKTGKGFYLYDGADIRPNPDVDGIITAERARAGITARAFSPDEIVERYMTAMISEAARVVEDGIALRPVDVDAVFLFGYGFPRFRGGPLHYADTLGAAQLIDRIERYAQDDGWYWQVPDILRRMATDGTTFADLNKDG